MVNEICSNYMQWYFDSNVWKNVSYRGVRTLKSVTDMWNYQEIIYEHDIEWVIETGSRHGGSALFFADVMQNKGAPGLVYSVDIDSVSNQAPPHPKLKFIIGDSGAMELAQSLVTQLPKNRKPLFLILDSDHTKSHVLRELNAFVPLLRSGDYLVVEDTCVNGHPVRPQHGDGPFEAIHDFLAKNYGILIPDKKREDKFGFTFAPDGFYLVK
ncbi:MAG: CmcI family methyltransferase [Pseudomonadota bacterium]